MTDPTLSLLSQAAGMEFYGHTFEEGVIQHVGGKQKFFTCTIETCKYNTTNLQALQVRKFLSL